nr:hypothetical protein HmN_000183700 [Hymenolepis microstoma]
MTDESQQRLRKQDLSDVESSCLQDSGASTNVQADAHLGSPDGVERYRKRNLSIMYELLQLCLTDEALKNPRSNINEPFKNIPFHEVLCISLRKLKTAIRKSGGINHLRGKITELWQLRRRLNIPSKLKRPGAISEKFHRKLCKMVEDIVKDDARRIESNGRTSRTAREVALEARTTVENLVTSIIAKHDVEDTATAPSFADCDAPTGAASDQSETNTGAKADVLHSSSGCHQPPSTTNPSTYSNPSLESGIDHSNSNHSVQSPRDTINPVENPLHFVEWDINFSEENDFRLMDNPISVDELYDAIVRDFKLDTFPDNSIDNPDVHLNLEIPDEEEEKTLKH